MISRIIWVIHRRCSRNALRSIGDAMRCFCLCALCSISPQQYANRTHVISSLSKISFGSHKVYVVPRKISPPFIFSPQLSSIPSPLRPPPPRSIVDICVYRTPKDHRPSPIVKVHRLLLTNDVARINSRCIAEYSAKCL